MTTQSLSLEPGWNAVWLEVEPRAADGRAMPPEAVFKDAAISSVATYSPTRAPVEFVENPSKNSLNAEGWAIWYRTDPARRANLREIQGHRAYLVRSSAALTLEITGEASFHVHRWQPDSYNLLGFGILDTHRPTFADFFGPAIHSHPVNRIFRLDPSRGNWVAVKPSDAMSPGAAYWIYAQGPSSYQGPFQLDFMGVGELAYGSDLKDQELLIFNGSGLPADFVMDRVNAPNGLELIHLVRDPAALTETEDVPIVQFPIGAAGPGQSVIETLRLRRAWTGNPEQRQLYRVSSTSLGTYFWLPASGVHPGLVPPGDETPNAPAQGLWVGDVILKNVSGRVPSDAAEAGTQADPVLAGPKARVILHVDAAGSVRLLKAVVFMRTRALDPADAEQVLVIHPGKIPYFEGIERRAGKRVGKRIETTFYDLPREVPPPDSLPPDFDQSALREEYLHALPLTGGVGPGKRCGTSPSSPLTLDAWHRSNPFRHAFHPAHASGFRIEREMSFAFDPPTSKAARTIPNYGEETLVGSFSETLKGLVRESEKILVAGRVVLRRVSRNPTLE